MFIETIKSPGLAQLSYLLGDEDAGECIVIDPRRDAQIYLDLAHRRECRLTRALETHIHADFVSGAREIQKIAGCSIHGGTSDEYGYEINQLKDGDTIELGVLTIECLHTPGHSPEHMSYLVRGGSGSEENWGLFTGDTLFAGSVGRPDLAAGMDSEELAGKLYHSLFDKLLPLGEGIIVYPGHGSGSPCGGSIGDRDQTTIGYEAKHNDKLQVSSLEEFVSKVHDDLPEEPAYYKRLKQLNAAGARLFGRMPVLEAVEAGRLEQEISSGDCLVLDVREVSAFGSAHIPGAVNIALRASFPPWAGRILPEDRPVYLVGGDFQDIELAQQHLFRMGFDNLAGYLNGGMRSWIEAGNEISQIGMTSIADLRSSLDAGDSLQLLDVRSEAEWRNGHLPGARHMFAAEIADSAPELNPRKPTVVYCGSDFRADLAASLLAAKGFDKVFTLLGSVKAWKSAGWGLEN